MSQCRVMKIRISVRHRVPLALPLQTGGRRAGQNNSHDTIRNNTNRTQTSHKHSEKRTQPGGILEMSTPLGDGRWAVRLLRRVGWTRRRRSLVGRSHNGWKGVFI